MLRFALNWLIGKLYSLFLNLLLYQLNIQPNTRIVKPTTKLVPDVEETSEYWVLDEIGVTKLGYVTISYNKKTNRYEFDDSKMKVDPMVTSEFRK